MKRGLGVSDLHCGSFYGLLPPNYITYEGVPKIQNAGQEYSWKCWLNFADRAEDFNPDFVIVNGDDVDGLQKKQNGAELSLTNWKDQRQAAIASLKVLRSVTRKAKWFFVQGTPYHVGSFGSAEEDIAEAMDATPYQSVGPGRLCKEVLTLDIEGVIVEAAHHISFASVYRSTPLEKESQAALMASARGLSVMPDLIIRSHVHSYSNVEQGHGRVVTTPAWQLPTRYARKSSQHRNLAKIGGIYIEVDGAAKKRGQSSCRVESELYKLPSIAITKF